LKAIKTFKDITSFFAGDSHVKELVNLAGSKDEVNIKILNGSLNAVYMALLQSMTGKRVLIVTPTREEAEDWYHDLTLLMDKSQLSLLVEPRKNVRFEAEETDDKIVWMMDGLSTLINNKSAIAVATPDILSIHVPAPDFIGNYNMRIEKGQLLHYEELIRNLALQGFNRMDFVTSQGEIAVRGGIVDIFPLGWDNPLRIEFWGDEVESIREFDPLSQRSIQTHQSVDFLANVFNSTQSDELVSLLDYLDPDDIVVLETPEIIISKFNDFVVPQSKKIININKLGEAGITVKSEPQPAFSSSVANFGVYLRKLKALNYKIAVTAEGSIHLERLMELVENALTMDNGAEEQTEEPMAPPDLTFQSIIWLNSSFARGFVLHDPTFACFTEHQIFGRLRLQEATTRRGKLGKGKGFSLKDLKQLQIGDYIVHEDKGIGRFDGFEQVTLGGTLQDCIRLHYSGGDILYVHLNYIHKIQKYTAQEGVVPTLSKLGTAEWQRKKARTKNKLKDIARDLIKLYAERKMQPGYSYPSDTLWQKEFEASFIYEDTPDQAKTTDEIKNDMQSSTPMDRLVCGDVGFGKTEVAIRAAFKAVQSGKQAAVLVPTTILAQQHYISFNERLSRYPVNVDVISRFKSKKEQKDTLDKALSGGLDVLIGTHRLLSKDVKFKDLGLLIIDEEHRFGVSSKEKLRELRANIDTLTLTATPIPRTLNFSLMGARDLSVIETPPRNRLPIYTEILEWNEKKITEAIHFEIERGGQVYFVTDKVKGIEKLKADLNMLMPTVKFGIAHGQMTTSELEKAMENFIKRKFDVLIATKIVESGLDIPNANTMLINRSDNFGLAELYQLRGRVGRSNKQAYCYLLIPATKTLSTNSLRRLQAIEEFTDLGSGFQLAMRDLEIRGAGNLLGPEQSGFINEIGFELFHKILDEAVIELRESEFRELFSHDDRYTRKAFENEDVSIETDTEALIPSTFIDSDTERFHFYKKLYKIRDNSELKETTEEMTDRFGKFPKQVEDLVYVVRLRMAAIPIGLEKVTVSRKSLLLEFPPNSRKEYYEKVFPEIAEYISQLENAELKQDEKKLTLRLNTRTRDEALEILWKLKKTVEMIDI